MTRPSPTALSSRFGVRLRLPIATCPSAFAFAPDRYGCGALYHFCAFLLLTTNFYVLAVESISSRLYLFVEFHPCDVRLGRLTPLGARSIQTSFLTPLKNRFCDRVRHGTCNSLYSLEHSRRSFASHRQLLTMDRRRTNAVRNKDSCTYIGQHCSLGIIVLSENVI